MNDLTRLGIVGDPRALGESFSGGAAEMISPHKTRLRQGTLSADVHRERLLAIGDLFVQGYSLDWDRLMADGSGRRISLPTYPFDGESYWVGAPAVERPRRVAQVLTHSWQVSASTQETSATAQQLADGARDLSGTAAELARITNGFTLSQG